MGSSLKLCGTFRSRQIRYITALAQVTPQQCKDPLAAGSGKKPQGRRRVACSSLTVWSCRCRPQEKLSRSRDENACSAHCFTEVTLHQAACQPRCPLLHAAMLKPPKRPTPQSSRHSTVQRHSCPILIARILSWPAPQSSQFSACGSQARPRGLNDCKTGSSFSPCTPRVSTSLQSALPAFAAVSRSESLNSNITKQHL